MAFMKQKTLFCLFLFCSIVLCSAQSGMGGTDLVAAAAGATSTQAGADAKGPIPFLYVWSMAQGGSSDFFLPNPYLLPPDLLNIPREGGLSVAVDYEKVHYEKAYDQSERLSVFPVYWSGAYRTVKIGRDATGYIINLELPDDKVRFTIMESEGNRPLRFRYEREGEQGFGVLQYGGPLVEENWYTETGELKDLYEYTWSGERLYAVHRITSDGTSMPLLGLEYNAQNRISSMVDDLVQTELLYDGRGQLIWAKSTYTEGLTVVRNYQYDERGLLVRLYGSDDKGNFEYRYRYGLDSRGLWTGCFIQAWYEQYGRLVPGPEIPITRTITRR
jgi:hypothetical protein